MKYNIKLAHLSLCYPSSDISDSSLTEAVQTRAPLLLSRGISTDAPQGTHPVRLLFSTLPRAACNVSLKPPEISWLSLEIKCALSLNKHIRNLGSLALRSCKVINNMMVKTWQCMKHTRARSKKQHGLQTAQFF